MNLDEVWNEFFGAKKEEESEEKKEIKEEVKPEKAKVEVKEEVKEEAKEEKREQTEKGSDEFDAKEEKGSGKIVIMIYGNKGKGKTFASLSLNGKIACLSFDRKSLPIKNLIEKKFDGKDIKVWDAMKYEIYDTPEHWLESSERTFRYINYLLDNPIRAMEPDWIVIDGSEILQQVCEMTMRYRNNIMPFQGIANRNVWKERRLYIRQIHNKALNTAKRGIVYTTYVDKDRIVIDGEVVKETDIPRWIDAILYETDIVIKVDSKDDSTTGRRFYMDVESSKVDDLKTGLRMDITDKGLKEVIK